MLFLVSLHNICLFNYIYACSITYLLVQLHICSFNYIYARSITYMLFQLHTIYCLYTCSITHMPVHLYFCLFNYICYKWYNICGIYVVFYMRYLWYYICGRIIWYNILTASGMKSQYIWGTGYPVTWHCITKLVVTGGFSMCTVGFSKW